MYEVYKHPAPFAGKKWAVKFPHGIECYRYRGKAEQVADEAKRLADAAMQAMFAPSCKLCHENPAGPNGFCSCCAGGEL